MNWKTLALALSVQAVAAQQMIRFGCSQLVVERLDPLVNPGSLVSPHVHQIVGGNSFNASSEQIPETIRALFRTRISYL